MRARTAGRSVALVATMLVVIGCGGGSTTSPGAGASTGTTPTEAPQPSDGAVPSEPVAGGGAGGGVCDLITTDELSAIFGVDGVTTTVFAGPPDTCSAATASGGALAAWVLTTAGGKMIFDSIALPGQSTEVSGLGDKAALIDNTGLVVLKGDSMLVIGVTTGDTDDERADFAKQLGAKAASRM